MLLRFVVALGGLAFLITGFGVLLAGTCRSVTWARVAVSVLGDSAQHAVTLSSKAR